MSTSELQLKRLMNTIIKMLPEINSNGITLRLKGVYKNSKILYTIDNPKNLSYTKEALSGQIDAEINSLKKFFPEVKSAAQFLYHLEGDGLYIPQKTLNEISSCLVGKPFNLHTQYEDKHITIEGRFSKDFYIEEDSEMIIVDVDLLVKSMEITLNGKVYNKFDEDEIYEILNEKFDLDIDNLTWECMTDDIKNNKSFVDFNWMGWRVYANYILPQS